MNKDRKKGVYSVASKQPTAVAAESCSIYYSVKPSLKDRAYCKAGMPDYQNVEKIIAAIPRMWVLRREWLWFVQYCVMQVGFL